MKTVSTDFCATLYVSKTSLPYPVTTICPFFPHIQDIKPYQSGGRHLLPFFKHCKQPVLCINIQAIMIWR